MIRSLMEVFLVGDWLGRGTEDWRLFLILLHSFCFSVQY